MADFAGRLLVIDDDEDFVDNLQDILEDEGYAIVAAHSCAQARDTLAANVKPDIVLLDLRLPDGDGLALLPEVRASAPEAEIILMTAFATVDSAISAMQHGAYNYLRKPVALKELELTLGHVMEVIQLRRQARADQRYQEQLAAAVEHAAELIAITDPDVHIIYVNPAFEERSGYTLEQLAGRNQDELMLTTSLDEVREAVQSGQRWSGRLEMKAAGGRLLVARGTCSPVLGSDGRLASVVCVLRDITHEEALEQRLRQSQKMEAIGTLAGGIAHDFNNVLFAIQGYTEMSLDDVGTASRAYGNLQEVLTASRRASELVKQILAFSRQGEQEIQSVQAELIVKEVARLIRAATPAMIQIRTAMPTEPCYVLCDPGQLHQVLMNLCTNARHAMEERGGQLSLAVQKVRFGEDGPAAPGGLEDGDYVRLVVADTGQGIPEVVRDRIFDPFFTTKAVGEGTGLGLAMVHGIIESLGGVITVDSITGQGTTFTIRLPLAGVDAGEQKAAAQPDKGASELIMFVDDEESLAFLMKEMLTSLGYRVEAYTASPAALAAFSASPDKYDLVITDQTMPSMNGTRLAAAIHAKRKDVPVMLCTGHGHKIPEADVASAGISQLIPKPVNKSELGRLIREVFSNKSAAGGRMGK